MHSAYDFVVARNVKMLAFLFSQMVSSQSASIELQHTSKYLCHRASISVSENLSDAFSVLLLMRDIG